MSFSSFITRQRNRYSSELVDDVRYWSLSAATYVYYVTISDVIKKYARGKTLDAGAGRLNGKLLLRCHVTEYASMDISDTDGMIDIVSDIQNMTGIPGDTFDTVYSSQVLEHVPNPCKALAEIHRVLAPGGYAIISVPLLSGLHEEPHDYYRYTPYGLKHLMQEAGFTVEDECTAGGLCCFLAHPFSLVFICMFWSIPVLRWVAWWINKLLFVHPVLWVENLTGLYRKFPSDIIVVGKKAGNSRLCA